MPSPTTSPRCPSLFPVWCREVRGIRIARAEGVVEIEENRIGEALGRERVLVAVRRHDRFAGVDLALVVDQRGAHLRALFRDVDELAAVMAVSAPPHARPGLSRGH